MGIKASFSHEERETIMSSAASATQVNVIRNSFTEKEVTFYKEEGYLLIRDLISAQDAALLRRETMDIMAAIGLPMTALRQTTEYLEGSGLDSLINSPRLLALAAQLMGGPSTLYMPFTAVKSGGGGGRFHFHQDNNYTRFDGPGINLWFALSPMTEENGCLQIAPKSHLKGTLESMASEAGHRKVVNDPKTFTSILMNPGDCVAFSRLTVHGSCPNVTPEPRVAYAVQFHRNDVKARREDGSYVSLLEKPRWKTGPVKAIAVPKAEKIEGH
ncbi:MAG TPA: phytanoyl-CoA dioxygenase family protein [Planctomycetota bacterium]|nr:phytanoyl-CoA dioxygenase family protein [Planctomycetota bacterium]